MVRIVISVKGSCVTSVVTSEDVEALIEDLDVGDVGPTALYVDPQYVDDVFEEYEHADEP